MRYCQVLLGLSGAAFLAYGVYCLFNPVALAASLGAPPSPALLSEMRAVYGGLQIWAGLLLLYVLWRPQWLHGAMHAYLLVILALVLPRSVGTLVDDSLGNAYVLSALAFEWGTVALLSLGLWLLRRERRAADA